MRHSAIIIMVLFMSVGLYAHNPLTAKFELKTSKSDLNILSIYLSQTGLHQAMLNHYSLIDLNSVDVEAYKILAIKYIKNKTNIKANGNTLILTEGGIKLGSHQTDVKFIVENVPTEINLINVDISCFNENDNHHSIFIWNDQKDKKKTILSRKNGFHATIGKEHDNPILSDSLSNYIVVGFTGMAALIFFGKLKSIIY